MAVHPLPFTRYRVSKNTSTTGNSIQQTGELGAYLPPPGTTREATAYRKDGAAEIELFEFLEPLFMVTDQLGDLEHDALRLGLIFGQ